jgi:hypothetical protein
MPAHTHDVSRCSNDKKIRKDKHSILFVNRIYEYVLIPTAIFSCSVFLLQVKNKPHDRNAKPAFILELGTVTNT